MKLYNQLLELEAIKIICKDKTNNITLLGQLDSSYFYTEVAQNSFNRIKELLKKNMEIPNWSTLVTDPTISDDTRDILINFAKDNKGVGNYKEVYQNLVKYRKARTLLMISENIQKELTKDSIDVENLFRTAAEKMADVKTGKDITDCFTRIGYESNTKELLESLLFENNSNKFYRTGFKQWDETNGGIPKGKLGLICATSGAGKSLCAEQLCINFGLNGVRTCLVPLEMNAKDMLQRFIANKTDIDMTGLNKLDGSDGAKKEAEKYYKQFEKFEKLLAENITSIDMFNPKDDINMEDLLTILRPFEYDVVIIDYIGLLAGFDNDDQWRRMAAAIRQAKIWAESTGTTVLCLAQLDDEKKIRYSRGMKEHADLMWTWDAGKLSDLEDSTTIIKVEPQKGRNQAQLTFYLKVDYKKMSMVDATKEEIEAFEKSESSRSVQRKIKTSNDNEDKNKKISIVQSGSLDNDLYADL